MTDYSFWPIAEVSARTGLGKTAIYGRLDQGAATHDPDFPRPVALSPRCVRWRSDEVLAWMEAKSVCRAACGDQRRELAVKAAKASVAKRKATAAELAGQA